VAFVACLGLACCCLAFSQFSDEAHLAAKEQARARERGAAADAGAGAGSGVRDAGAGAELRKRG